MVTREGVFTMAQRVGKPLWLAILAVVVVKIAVAVVGGRVLWALVLACMALGKIN